MPVKRAIVAYKEERLNCAQSVLRAFQEEREISDDDIAEARWLGGGRAKDGMCGALYAALSLTDDPSVGDSLRIAFVTSTGAERCRDIRRAKRTPCIECVRIATNLLVKHGGTTPSHSGAPAPEYAAQREQPC